VGVHNRYSITYSEFHKQREKAEDSVGLRSSMDLLACAGERALHAGELAANGAYADAQGSSGKPCQGATSASSKKKLMSSF
jgi:hypothetical protein